MADPAPNQGSQLPAAALRSGPFLGEAGALSGRGVASRTTESVGESDTNIASGAQDAANPCAPSGAFSFSNSAGAAAGPPSTSLQPVSFNFGAAPAALPAAGAGGVFKFGAGDAAGSDACSEASCELMEMLTDDLTTGVMRAAGPRWTCMLGATCKRLHALSTLDHLWAHFWALRAAFVPSFFVAAAHRPWIVSDGPEEAAAAAAGEGDEGAETAAAGAAATGRDEAGQEEDESTEAVATSSTPAASSTQAGGLQWRGMDMPKTGIAAAYAQVHAKLPSKPKMVEVTVFPGPTKRMEPVCCGAGWRGRMTPDDEWEICGADAQAWCDWPNCQEARCTAPDTLYRTPVEPGSADWGSGSCRGSRGREDPESGYEVPEHPCLDQRPFARCSWCAVQACPAHAAECGWRRCDICELSSCPDCVAEVQLGSTGICGEHDR